MSTQPIDDDNVPADLTAIEQIDFVSTPPPAEWPDDVEDTENMTDIERIEFENGFRFGDPDGDAESTPTPTRALICRNPHCSMNAQHVAVHPDTIQPIRCGGLTTDPNTGTTAPCGTVLHCDHTTETTTTTGGTLAAPTRTTTTRCTKCSTTTAETTENLPPIPLDQLPAALLDQLTETPATGAEPATL